MLEKVKCSFCGRTLGELKGVLRIICRRCGKENTISTTENTRKADQASQGE